MKKLLWIIVPLLFIFSAVTAQNKDSSNVYYDIKKNVKDITHGVVNDIKDGLSGSDSAFNRLSDSSKISFGSVYTDIKNGIGGMAAALKVGAAHVYEVLVRQQIAKSIMILLVFISGIILLRMAWKTSKSENWKEDGNPANGYAILSIVFWVIGCVCVIYGICRSLTMITGFVNPEYGAMEDIVDFVKKIKGGSGK